GGVVLDVVLVQGVQQRVTGTVGGGTGTGSLTALTVVLGLTTEGALIDAALLGAGERQAHVLQLEHGLRTYGAHVFDGILVTDVVGTLDGVIHVPAPVVVRISRSDGTGDAALGGNGVRTGREHLGYNGSLVTTLSQLQRRAHTGTTTTDDDGVKSQSTNISHGSKTPQDLYTPDEQHEHQQTAHHLKQEAQHGCESAESHGGEVVGRNSPHTDPGMHSQRHQRQQTEDAHGIVAVQGLPLLVAQSRIEDQVAQQEDGVGCQQYGGNALRHPVIQAATRQVGDVGYHIHTPSRTIR